MTDQIEAEPYTPTTEFFEAVLDNTWLAEIDDRHNSDGWFPRWLAEHDRAKDAEIAALTGRIEKASDRLAADLMMRLHERDQWLAEANAKLAAAEAAIAEALAIWQTTDQRVNDHMARGWAPEDAANPLVNAADRMQEALAALTSSQPTTEKAGE